MSKGTERPIYQPTLSGRPRSRIRSRVFYHDILRLAAPVRRRMSIGGRLADKSIEARMEEIVAKARGHGGGDRAAPPSNGRSR